MKRTFLSQFSVLAVLFLASPGHAQPDPADRLMAEGMELGKQSKWTEARAKISEAWKLKKSYDIAGNLGLVENQLGDHAAAAEHLDYARRTMPAHIKPEKRKRIEEQLAEAKAKVGCVRLAVNVDGARLKLGERTLGPTPTEDLLCAAAGAHALSIERDGYSTDQRSWTAQAGKEERLSVELKAAAQVGAGGAGGAGGSGGSGGVGGVGGSGGVGAGGTGGGEPVDETRPVWPAGVLGGVAAAGLAVGITGIVLDLQNASDADEAQAALGEGACASATDGACADISDSLEQAGTFRAIGIAGFCLAGAAGIAAIVYVALPDDEKRAGAMRVHPIFGSANGLVLEGSF